MAAGYAATFTRVFGRDAANALAAFVFYFAIPVMMFRNMATTELPETIAWGYLGSYFLGVAVVFGIGMTTARFAFGGSFERQAIIGFGSAFGNSVLLGIPLVLTSFGEQASLPLFLLLAFHSTVLFTAITVILEAGRCGRSRGCSATRSSGAWRAASASACWACGCRARSSALPCCWQVPRCRARCSRSGRACAPTGSSARCSRRC
jgi:predicted permease